MRLIIEILIAALFTALMAIVLIELSVGCGETYTDSQGVEHQNDCVFIPSRTDK